MKKVSIVVPCYNAAVYLRKCIDHLLNQTIGIENIEIILVNDASTDNGETWDLIMQYEQKFPDVILAVSLEQNMRQGGARNVGISLANSEYLIFCDADDWLLVETLEHCYCCAKEYDADVVEFLICDVDEHSKDVELVSGGNSRLIELNTEERRKKFLFVNDVQFSLGSQKKMFKLSMIKENHIMFAEHLIFEEPSFMLPVRFYEQKHYFLDEQLYICYLSRESTVRGEWGEHKWDNPKVWMQLVNDMAARGMLQNYYTELEYMFFKNGLGLSISMALQKGYRLTREEIIFLVDMTLRIFPDVRGNKYVRNVKGIWEKLLISLLDMEITEESTAVVNEVMRKYV